MLISEPIESIFIEGIGTDRGEVKMQQTYVSFRRAVVLEDVQRVGHASVRDGAEVGCTDDGGDVRAR